jgi:hypothetical protein
MGLGDSGRVEENAFVDHPFLPGLFALDEAFQILLVGLLDGFAFLVVLLQLPFQFLSLSFVPLQQGQTYHFDLSVQVFSELQRVACALFVLYFECGADVGEGGGGVGLYILDEEFADFE